MDINSPQLNGLKAHDLKLTNDVLFKFIFGKEERKSLTIAFLMICCVTSWDDKHGN